MTMYSLTKKDFWDDIEEKFPDQYRDFSGWIDLYKQKGAWLLNIQPQVKFHNLPLELQIGILGRFFHQQYNLEEFYVNLADGPDSVASVVRNAFWQVYYSSVEKKMEESMGSVATEDLGNGSRADSMDWFPGAEGEIE